MFGIGIVTDTILQPYNAIQRSHLEAHVNYYCLDNDERETMELCIKSAISYTEKMTRKRIHKRQIVMVGAGFPKCGIRLVNTTPIQSVDSITYKDSVGDSQSFTDFQIDKRCRPYTLYPSALSVWPNTYAYDYNAVTVTLTCGYQDHPTQRLEDDLVIGIRQLAATYWVNREHLGEIASLRFPIPNALQSILLTYREINEP